MHEIELAVRNGAASWCQCSCGWVSAELSEDEAITSWAAHVAASALAETSRPVSS